MKNSNFMIRCLVNSTLNKIFLDKRAPFDIWYISLFRAGFAKRTFSRRRFGLNEEEKELFIPLFQLIYASKPSTDWCMGYLFKRQGPVSDLPLLPIWQQLARAKRIDVMYGDSDWMDHELTVKRVQEKQLPIEVHFVPKSGHQIVFENPGRAADRILEKAKQWQVPY